MLRCGVLENNKSKSKKGHNSEKKNTLKIVSLDSMDCSLDSEHIFLVSNNQVNMFSNNRDITNCQSFCMTPMMPRL